MLTSKVVRRTKEEFDRELERGMVSRSSSLKVLVSRRQSRVREGVR